MASYAFKLPDIGEGIAEAEIVAWHVAVGDVVEEDQPLADMMTDKATVEMTAPVAGKVTKLAGEVGEQVAIGSVLAEFEVEGGADANPEPTVQVAPPEAGQVALPDPMVEEKREPEPEKPLTFRGGGEEGPRLARRACARERSRHRSRAGEARRGGARAPCRSRRVPHL